MMVGMTQSLELKGQLIKKGFVSLSLKPKLHIRSETLPTTKMWSNKASNIINVIIFIKDHNVVNVRHKALGSDTTCIIYFPITSCLLQ